MAFSAKAVANYFLGRAKSEGQSLDPMQIQKLVYYGQGWHLALRDKSLIRETIEAWPYGPVIESLFHEFKRWGSGAIRELAMRDEGGIFGRQYASLDQEATFDEDLEAANSILDRVWQVYGNYSGIQLSDLTHKPNSPWATARAASRGARNIPISNESMKTYFKARVQRNVHDQARA
jgi:uncharacterized phage-associated protein